METLLSSLFGSVGHAQKESYHREADRIMWSEGKSMWMNALGLLFDSPIRTSNNSCSRSI